MEKKKKSLPAARAKAPAKPQTKMVKKPAAKAIGKPAMRPAAPVAASRPVAFNNIVLLASGDELLAAEVEMRLRTVARYAAKDTVVPPVIRVAEIDTAPDALAMALYRSYRGMGRNAPTLFLCGGPEAGTPVLIRTDWNNTILTTNNGALGLVTTLLTQRKIPYTVQTLDIDRLETLEQARMNNPEYMASEDFMLRDILAPAAALLLAGRSADSIVTAATRTRAAGEPSPTPFQAGVMTAGSALGKVQHFTALRQANGSYLTNLTLDPLSFDQWRDDHAEFALQFEQAKKMWQVGKAIHAQVEGLHLEKSATSLHLSPHWAPVWDERFLTIRAPESGVTEEIVRGTLTRHR